MPECLMFEHGLTLGPSGAVRPCCAFEVSGENLFINDDWKKRHLEWAQQSKTKWLSGCEECRLAEKQNGHSLRTFANQALKNKYGIVYWDLKINNTCNLACRMCDSWNSSTWERIVKQNPDIDKVYHGQKKDSWHKDIDQLLPLLLDAKIVKFTGGEPFLIPQVKKVIDYLIDTETNQIIELSFTTNGTQDITDWIPKLKEFKSVNIIFSIDAIGERFEYIRAGSKWSQVSENILKIKNQTTKTNIGISVTALPQALNRDHIDEVKYWCEKNQISYQKSPPLIYPEFMRPEALDDPRLKIKLIENMKKLDQIHGTNYRDFINE